MRVRRTRTGWTQSANATCCACGWRRRKRGRYRRCSQKRTAASQSAIAAESSVRAPNCTHRWRQAERQRVSASRRRWRHARGLPLRLVQPGAALSEKRDGLGSELKSRARMALLRFHVAAGEKLLQVTLLVVDKFRLVVLPDRAQQRNLVVRQVVRHSLPPVRLLSQSLQWRRRRYRACCVLQQASYNKPSSISAFNNARSLHHERR